MDIPRACEILGVRPDAGPQVIKAAWRALAQEMHPDRHPGPDATTKMQELNAAYDLLSTTSQEARVAACRPREDRAGPRWDGPSSSAQPKPSAAAAQASAAPTGQEPFRITMDGVLQAAVGLLLTFGPLAALAWYGHWVIAAAILTVMVLLAIDARHHGRRYSRAMGRGLRRGRFGVGMAALFLVVLGLPAVLLWYGHWIEALVIFLPGTLALHSENRRKAAYWMGALVLWRGPIFVGVWWLWYAAFKHFFAVGEWWWGLLMALFLLALWQFSYRFLLGGTPLIKTWLDNH